MDPNLNLSPSDAHPDTMDLLSRAWCNFAVQSLQPEPQDRSLVLLDNPLKQLDATTKVHPAVSIHTVISTYYIFNQVGCQSNVCEICRRWKTVLEWMMQISSLYHL